jgi:hypothetical protein
MRLGALGPTTPKPSHDVVSKPDILGDVPEDFRGSIEA